MTRKLPTFVAALLIGALATAPCASAAKSRFTIKGAGFGHGVGMSQYGAMGYAQHGASAAQILAHYYTDTSLGTTDPSRDVRVLLVEKTKSARITGARQAGSRDLDPSVTYTLKLHGLTEVDLLASGKRLATFTAPLQVAGENGIVSLSGKPYRGTLEFKAGLFNALQVVNSVNLEDYLKGVVPAESPASWPAAALQAQAIAARTYAITTGRSGDFAQYADTRSQVYSGVSVETPATNQAVASTRGQVVTYQGQPVTTYFFSTSGGRTEDVENTTLGTEPRPWLKSVDDPYDDVSPRHRWTPTTTTLKQAGKKLRGLYKGSFRGIKVLERGASPRIMSAQVLGTKGSTTTDGATLRAKLGLYDTWAYFTTVTGKASGDPPPQTQAADASGGAPARLSRVGGPALSGTVIPGRRGATARVQVRRDGRWADAGTVALGRGGTYRWPAPHAGTYRVVFEDAPGPAVRVR
jgi:stage II sporulation protein D